MPKSYRRSAEGIRLEAILALKIAVSEESEPKTILPLAVKRLLTVVVAIVVVAKKVWP